MLRLAANPVTEGTRPAAGLGHTLADSVRRAVAQLPELRVALARRGAADAQVGQARAELLPSVNLSLGEGRETSRNPSTRGLPADPTLTRREREVTVTQLLFDGGASWAQLARQRERAEGAVHVVADTAETLGARAGQAFLEVQRLREQRGIAQRNLEVHRRTLEDVTALADGGRGRRVDVTQAEARFALAESSLDQLAGQLAQAEAAYRHLTGVAPPALEPAPALAARMPGDIRVAVAEALERHPAAQSARRELEAASEDRDAARARLVAPRVTLEAGASRNRDLDGVNGLNQDRYALLRLRYNLFRGFGDDERVREAEARLDEARAALERVRNDLERDALQAWESLGADRRRLPQLERYAAASADVAEGYRLQFQLGQRSLLDVLNAENERAGASANLVAGRAAVSAGEVRVLASLGRLLDALGIEAPGPSAKPEPKARP